MQLENAAIPLQGSRVSAACAAGTHGVKLVTGCVRTGWKTGTRAGGSSMASCPHLLPENHMNCLRNLLLAPALMATASLLHAAGPGPAAPVHPIVGTWSWVTFGGSCVETWQFRPNRTVLGTSGEEVVEKTYEISAAPDAAGFYRLVETVLRQNDKKDCAGAVLDGPGEQGIRFIQFSPQRDKLLVCQTAALTACFGPLKRVP